MANGKYALITGATQGIGYELAKLFVKDKYNLIIVARDQSELAITADEFRKEGIEVITISKDLFQKEAAFQVYEEVKEKEIEIEILVNNAGQGEYGKFNATDLKDELDIIQLNIGATVILTKLFIKDMIDRGSGKVLNLSSIAGKVAGPYQAVYHGTKSFIHSFTEGVRSELKDTGVTLTSLLPGATDTDFFNKANMNRSKIVQGDLADPAKVAKDGYEALMEGDDMVVSGLKNKAMVAGSSILPDRMAAESMKKQQEPAKKKEKK